MLGSFAHMAHSFHEGEKLKQIIKEITTLKKLAKVIDVHRNTLGDWLKKPSLTEEQLITVGKGLRYDLTSVFPKKLKNYPGSEDLHYFNEDPAPYFNDLKKVQELLSNEKQKAADANLQVSMLQEKILDLKQIIDEKNHLIESKNEIIEMLKSENEMMKSGEKSA